MSASEGMIGYDTTITVEPTPGAGFGASVELAEILNVTPPNKKTDTPERTHMKSPGRTKEFVPGMIDPGDSTFKLNHIPASDTDDFLSAWDGDGTVRAVRITYPNGHSETFPASVSTYAADSFGPSGVITSTLVLKVSGEVVKA